MTRSCCAPGCTMRAGTNMLSEIKFYKFPTCEDRRNRWIQAMRREFWKPTKHSLLCSSHFISGRPSSDANHPDWIPSIFAHRPIDTRKRNCSMARYERATKRQKNDSTQTPSSVVTPVQSVSKNEIVIDNSLSEVPPIFSCRWV